MILSKKRCNECLVEKVITDFNRRSKKPNDYKGKCKDCERPRKSASTRMRRADGRDKTTAADRKRWRKRWASMSRAQKETYNARRRELNKFHGEEYKKKQRVFRKKYYYKDIEASRNKVAHDYYKYTKKLPEPLIQAHVALTKVKRAIHGKTKR